MDRHVIRQTMKKMRQDLSPDDYQKLSLQVQQHFISNEIFTSAHHIACYYPIKHEVATDLLIKQAWMSNKSIYLPVIHASLDAAMDFCLYNESMRLQKNAFNIPEPVDTTTIDLDQLDVIVMPLLACDKHGNRIGMGAGYYDKTLAEFREMKRPLLVGFAYEFQLIDSIVAETWDIPLDLIVTEQGCYASSSKE